MKKVKQLHRLFSAMLILLLIACNNDDDNAIKNRAPESFQLTEENFTVMYNREKKTVNIDWPNVKDPDGELVKYHLKINDEQKASDLSISEVELPSSEFSGSESNYKFEITVTDPGGLTSTASAERILFSNEAPQKPKKVAASPTFYGAKLSWEAATDPDQNKVYYSIEIGGTIVAEGIESTSFIVRGYNEETAYKATIKAVDEFGAESEGQTVEFTTLKKETITSPTVTVKVWGVVVNEKGEAVEGATVKIEGQEQKTNKRGWFIFNKVTMSQSRGMLTVTAPNYFKSFKTIKAIDGTSNSQRIELLPKTIIGTINATQGGEVSSDVGMKVALPENAFGDYAGEVKVATRLMDPTDEDFGFQNPGLESYNAQGEYGTLQSFGMAAIEMQDADGNELQLKAGKQAVLTFPVPKKLGEFAPKTIPLWAFDEDQNIWVEEGQAELKNGVYVGKVGHFSIWNCDDFLVGREVCFTVVDKNDKPITNAYVEIILENGMVGSGFTNEEGEICTFMPTGASFSLNVSIGGAGGRQCNIITGQKGDGVPFGTTRVSRIIKAQGGQGLYVSIEGTATDCNDAPLKNSFVVVRDPQDNVILTGFTDKDGKFFLQGLHCFPVEGGESNRIEVIAYDYLNDKYSKPQEFRVVSNHIIAEESFKACQDGIPPFGQSGGTDSKIYKGNVTFKSNQEVIEFVSKGYTDISGSLSISGEAVTNIAVLKGRLRTVSRDIKIEKTGVTNLSGLNSITDVGRDLIINYNDKLKSISGGFSVLEEVGRDLAISGNDALESIDGFNEIEKANTHGINPWSISSNDALQSITGFNKLKEASYLSISQNKTLQSIDGFKGLEKAESLTISDNDALQSIDVFKGLEKITKGLSISHNDALQNITGFNKLKEASYLSISQNKTLQSIDGFFEELEKVTATLTISDNDALTAINVFNKPKELKDLTISRNKTLQRIDGFDGLEKVTGTLTIYNNEALQSINEFNNLKEIDVLSISENKALPGIDGLFGKIEKIRHLSISHNDALQSINGSGNLKEIGDQLRVTDNKSLQSIVGFNGVEKADGGFIHGNEALQSISGFSKLEKARDWKFTQNHALQSITAFTGLKEIEQLGIYNNRTLPIIDGFNALEKAGNLRITSNSGLKSISGFSNLQGLFKTLYNDNYLNISSNGLESITGFQKMVSAGSFLISSNIKLTSITGFQNLTEVTSFKIYLFKCVDLNAFANIERVGDLFEISQGSNLETLPDFNKIKTTAEMKLSQLPKLAKLPAFNSLETVKNLTIWANDVVKSINGFNNLTTVSERLAIDRNSDVMKIDGFNKLQTVKELYIAGNGSLTDYCGIPKALWDPNGSIQSFELKNNSYNPTQQELFNGTCKQ